LQGIVKIGAWRGKRRGAGRIRVGTGIGSGITITIRIAIRIRRGYMVRIGGSRRKISIKIAVRSSWSAAQ
jgi:hypothetical protein